MDALYVAIIHQVVAEFLDIADANRLVETFSGVNSASMDIARVNIMRRRREAMRQEAETIRARIMRMDAIIDSMFA